MLRLTQHKRTQKRYPPRDDKRWQNYKIYERFRQILFRQVSLKKMDRPNKKQQKTKQNKTKQNKTRRRRKKQRKGGQCVQEGDNQMLEYGIPDSFHPRFSYLHLVHTILFSVSFFFWLLSVRLLLSLPDEDNISRKRTYIFVILSSFVICW